MDLWTLPTEAVLGGEAYPHRTDFREMLKLMGLFDRSDRPGSLLWLTALSYFYRKPIPRHLEDQAMAYLSDFLSCGSRGKPGPKLLDWQTDGAAIIADVNAAAGCEIRSLPHLHWWTFLSYFHSIREGQLSLLVTIRQKLARGEALAPHEREYYQANKAQIRMRPPETAEDTAHRKALEALLHR